MNQEEIFLVQVLHRGDRDAHDNLVQRYLLQTRKKMRREKTHFIGDKKWLC